MSSPTEEVKKVGERFVLTTTTTKMAVEEESADVVKKNEESVREMYKREWEAPTPTRLHRAIQPEAPATRGGGKRKKLKRWMKKVLMRCSTSEEEVAFPFATTTTGVAKVQSSAMVVPVGDGGDLVKQQGGFNEQRFATGIPPQHREHD